MGVASINVRKSDDVLLGPLPMAEQKKLHYCFCETNTSFPVLEKSCGDLDALDCLAVVVATVPAPLCVFSSVALLVSAEQPFFLGDRPFFRGPVKSSRSSDKLEGVSGGRHTLGRADGNASFYPARVNREHVRGW